MIRGDVSLLRSNMLQVNVIVYHILGLFKLICLLRTLRKRIKHMEQFTHIFRTKVASTFVINRVEGFPQLPVKQKRQIILFLCVF